MEVLKRGLVLLMVFMVFQRGEGQLFENFYRGTCPNLEMIVKQVVSTKFTQTFVTIPATLRLFFHDCFVEGCDASVMIASPNGDAEKDAQDNLSLAGDGFDTVIKAKQAVEVQCPGIVSCADILALAARDVVVLVGEGKLSQAFYNSTCPNVESIVRKVVEEKFSQTFVTVPATLRLFFHDCFVEGCDASIMIASPNGDAEKDAPDNLSLAGDGFDTVIKAKKAVEAKCPKVVSCADILAIATRDVIVLAGGPSFEVELGRRDGFVSKASRVAGQLPGPNFNLSQLNSMFAQHNLTQTDMIALSGAHTVGFSHCSRFANRLYSFSPSSSVDPDLDPTYVKQLKQACPQNVDPSIAINMDPVTPRTFDNKYFKNLVAKKGLFTSDEVLYTNRASRPTVVRFSKKQNVLKEAFITAMRKLGRVGVKTGKHGEIRVDCTAFN
ncbi:hypothetical protein ES332_D04G090900v1 [Gossypium tomentosum]|uniref:peroxidase n=1 Tax=Gossypium tomentosum TaxID=34277 RepID=A0A5D2LBN6_GOSTO|nr:hypothetical protein ES332_D04G090900v1 [Gossypium tomentosum]